MVADRASSLEAIGYARKTLSKDKLNLILAGGMEAPVTPYALLCCNTYGCLSKNKRGAHYLEIQSIDGEILYKIRDALKSNIKIGAS